MKGMKPVPAAPSPAATVVVLRHGSSGVEVLMLQRHARSGFMANAYVFPGGRVEPQDRDSAFVGHLLADAMAVELDRMEALTDVASALSHWVAAIRETFEESGILFAKPDNEEHAYPSAEARFAWQQRLNRGEISFKALLESRGLRLDTGRLVNLSHWVTPEFEKRRFSARFFLAPVYADEAEEHADGTEATASVWIRPEEALRRHAEGNFRIAPPQWVTLKLLSQFETVEMALAWARAQKRIEVCQPHPFTLDQAIALALPGDPEHPTSPTSKVLNRVMLRDGRWSDV